MSPFEIGFLVFLIIMFVQGVINIYLNLYVWQRPQRLANFASPIRFLQPQISFTVLLPARHEQEVIGHTLRALAVANYPKSLLDILIICEERDVSTISAAEDAINKYQISNARVVTFNDKPINKPHALNVGLSEARGDSCVIFDAEDEVHRDIFNIANTIYLQQRPDIIQAGVQLMNYHSRWFSAHNVLEYFFWFKSRMHFNTRKGVVPLGGNSVFFKTRQLRAARGWNEQCLTEDAEIGIRLSSQGARVCSTYDSRHVTKEETPPTVAAFIKQRTRWNQGFIQVLRAGDWRRYKGWSKKMLCVYILSFPIIQGILFLCTPLILAWGFINQAPVAISLFSFTPLLLALVQVGLYAVGIYEFTKEQDLKLKLKTIPMLLLTFLGYQCLLGLGALRAVYREARGQNNWEKTEHQGAHRASPPAFIKAHGPIGNIEMAE